MLSKAREEECIWYDHIHPTRAMHRIVAEDLYKELPKGAKEKGEEGTDGSGKE